MLGSSHECQLHYEHDTCQALAKRGRSTAWNKMGTGNGRPGLAENSVGCSASSQVLARETIQLAGYVAGMREVLPPDLSILNV